MKGKFFRLLILLLIVSFVPSFSTMTTARSVLWTISGPQGGGGLYNYRWARYEPSGFYFYGSIGSFRAGRNDKEIIERQKVDRYKDHQWTRLRLGFPLRSITIDKMDGVNDWHMYFEHAFWLNLTFWFGLWLFYQVLAAAYRRLREGRSSTQV